ncbi:MAG: hypothetical protein RLZZ99_943, partial [Actinomycetota bacterium]
FNFFHSRCDFHLRQSGELLANNRSLQLALVTRINMLEVATATSSWVCILASSFDSMWRTMEDFNTITSSEILCDLSYLDERSLPRYRMTNEYDSAFGSSDAMSAMCDCGNFDFDSVADLQISLDSRADYRWQSLKV